MITRGEIFYLALCFIFLSKGVPAQPLNVDWRYFGSSNAGGDASVCFYDTRSTTTLPDNHIRVWTKCLPQQEVDSVDPKSEMGIKITNTAAEKIAHYYVPPFAEVDNISVEQAAGITVWEETADIAEISPQAQIYYELDCPNRMLRTLTVDLQMNGRSGSEENPGSWDYVPPESDGGWLLSILCPHQ